MSSYLSALYSRLLMIIALVAYVERKLDGLTPTTSDVTRAKSMLDGAGELLSQAKACLDSYSSGTSAPSSPTISTRGGAGGTLPPKQTKPENLDNPLTAADIFDSDGRKRPPHGNLPTADIPPPDWEEDFELSMGYVEAPEEELPPDWAG